MVFAVPYLIPAWAVIPTIATILIFSLLTYFLFDRRKRNDVLMTLYNYNVVMSARDIAKALNCTISIVSVTSYCQRLEILGFVSFAVRKELGTDVMKYIIAESGKRYHEKGDLDL